MTRDQPKSLESCKELQVCPGVGPAGLQTITRLVYAPSLPILDCSTMYDESLFSGTPTTEETNGG